MEKSFYGVENIDENFKLIFHKPFRSKIIEGLAEVLAGIGGRVEF